MRTRLFALALILGLPSATLAEENRMNIHLELAPLFVVSQPTGIRNDLQFQTAGFHIRGAFEYQLTERFGAEIAYSPDLLIHQVTNGIDAVQVIQLGVRFKPWYSPKGGYILPLPEPKFRKPLTIVDVISDAWVDVHAGVALAGGNKTRFVYDVGIGARVPILSPLQPGLFVRWQHMIGGGDDMIMQVIAGFTVSIGFLDVPTCGDSDLDGVCDGQDECPDTKGGTTVDKKGCPPQAPEPPPEVTQ